MRRRYPRHDKGVTDVAIRLEPVKIEAYDDANECVFSVECFDDCAATIKLHEATHTVESWQEIAEAITEALKRLELKTD